MAVVMARPRGGRYVCPRPSEAAGRGLAVVRCGRVWEVRDACGVVSWASTLDAAIAEAARHERGGSAR
jgi:hypothetical protein